MFGALIGYGTIAASHHDAYLKTGDQQVVAVVDVNEHRRLVAQQRDPRVSVYRSMADMLSKERLDFVDICTPPSLHFTQQIQALEAGCHILCEKPFLLDRGDFSRLLERVARGDCLVYPSHNYKFSPVMRFLVDRIRLPQFGQLRRGYFRTTRNGHARGVAEWEPDWRRIPAHAGGGIIQDHATHSIYLACHLFDRRPHSVSCTLGNLARDQFTATEDTAHLALYFPEGVEVRLDLTWACGVRSTSYALLGTRQNIVVENDQVLVTGSGREKTLNIASNFDDPGHTEWFVDMFRDFRNSIGDPAKQTLLLSEAWTTCATVQAAYESARDGGHPVRIEAPPASLDVRRPLV